MANQATLLAHPPIGPNEWEDENTGPMTRFVGAVEKKVSRRLRRRRMAAERRLVVMLSARQLERLMNVVRYASQNAGGVKELQEILEQLRMAEG